MVNLKSQGEIEVMKEGGIRLRNVVKDLIPTIEVGISTEEIDKKAESLIIEYGGESSFKKVPGYQWSTCLPINEQVVHTPPSKRIIKDGDVLTVDIGMYYKGYHTDYADTIIVGKTREDKIKRFLEVGKTALYKAIDQARVGNRLGHISKVIENEIYGNGYKILKNLTGHGIGRELHEDPYIFGFLDRPIEKTITIQSGLVIAIEIIYALSSEEFVHQRGDDWSVVTADKSISACFEHTVAITDKITMVLT
ncbi:type I methionyl aminopeptidase [Candidatus Roizmanbacteria bacterium]|nr:type I methionyl aminopeptidase [Candidatus Roizmanbacteria bacterium]